MPLQSKIDRQISVVWMLPEEFHTADRSAFIREVLAGPLRVLAGQVEQGMMPPPRRAQAVDAPADLPLARQLLAQADRHFASAAIPGVDLDIRFGMLYDAARKAADAIMRTGGRRVTQGIGHHIVFFEEAKRLLPAADSGLVARVEGARNTRNAMEYQAR